MKERRNRAVYSQSRHSLKVSVQLYSPASLSKGRDAVPIGYEAGGIPEPIYGKGNSKCHCQEPKPNYQAIALPLYWPSSSKLARLTCCSTGTVSRSDLLTPVIKPTYFLYSMKLCAPYARSEQSVNPSAWGHLNPSSYCDVGRLFYGVFKLWSKLQRKK